METVIFVLVLYVGNPSEIIEHIGFWENPITRKHEPLGLANCLSTKRKIARLSGFKNTKGGQYRCQKWRVSTRENYQGQTVINELKEMING